MHEQQRTSTNNKTWQTEKTWQCMNNGNKKRKPDRQRTLHSAWTCMNNNITERSVTDGEHFTLHGKWQQTTQHDRQRRLHNAWTTTTTDIAEPPNRAEPFTNLINREYVPLSKPMQMVFSQQQKHTAHVISGPNSQNHPIFEFASKLRHETYFLHCGLWAMPNQHKHPQVRSLDIFVAQTIFDKRTSGFAPNLFSWHSSGYWHFFDYFWLDWFGWYMISESADGWLFMTDSCLCNWGYMPGIDSGFFFVINNHWNKWWLMIKNNHAGKSQSLMIIEKNNHAGIIIDDCFTLTVDPAKEMAASLHMWAWGHVWRHQLCHKLERASPP